MCRYAFFVLFYNTSFMLLWYTFFMRSRTRF
jgi:hypothetical protein